MKKNENLNLKLRKFLVFFILFYFLLLAVMEINFFWDNLYKIEKKIGFRYTKIIYDFHNNIDLTIAIWSLEHLHTLTSALFPADISKTIRIYHALMLL